MKLLLMICALTSIILTSLIAWFEFHHVPDSTVQQHKQMSNTTNYRRVSLPTKNIKMNSFYVYLPSNVKNSIHNNTVANYVTPLNGRKYFDRDWEVALVHMFYTKNWYNVNRTLDIKLQRSDEEPVNLPSSSNNEIPIGLYSASELCDTINEKLESMCQEYRKQIKKEMASPMFVYHETTNRVSEFVGKIRTEPPVLLRAVLPNVVSRMLGSDTDYSTEKMRILKRVKHNSVSHVDMNAGLKSLYVYSDIVEPSFLGDTHGQILRVIPCPTKKYGETIEVNFDHPIYIPLRKREIDSIEIDIRDEAGDRVKFTGGSVFIILHFRQRNESN